MKFERDRIKDLREQNGLSLGEFARKLRTSRAKVAGWEGGYTCPNMASLESICQEFDIDPGYFFVENNVKTDDLT